MHFFILLSLFLSTIVGTSGKCQDKSYSVEIRLKGVDDNDSFYLKGYLDDAVVAGSIVKNGTCKFSGKTDEIGFPLRLFKRESSNAILLLVDPGSQLRVTGTWTFKDVSIISHSTHPNITVIDDRRDGSQNSKNVFLKFVNKQLSATTSQNELSQIAQQFVIQNPNNSYCMFLIHPWSEFDLTIPYEKRKELYAGLNRHLWTIYWGKQLAMYFEEKDFIKFLSLKSPIVGERIPNFKLYTDDRREDSLYSFIGKSNAKLTLLLLWKPYKETVREEFQRIKEIQDKYYNEGLRVISIGRYWSFDAWSNDRKYLERDVNATLPWLDLGDVRKGDWGSSESTISFGALYFKTKKDCYKVLLGEKGEIISHGLLMDQVSLYLSKVFNKED
ncbi:DUF4369 domain-containing protein [Pseudoflavitalea sp. X16]|uniref:DUF4369 domain-containing protein n=1 Tax=Paraflavitalea devenefica TaxID=2716334 RepID=UPI0014246CB5|nr:DUF4369 domain-containing protein [Paraflavitalea devenefica]NII27498.1 DUF4369 domain-containing protein [Paraflavitalea devenefica]